MRKIWVFIQSDGWSNTFRFIWKSILNKICHTSKTLCLYAEYKNVSFENRKVWSDLHCKIVTDWEELRDIDFDRLKLLPCQEWLECGSMVCILFYNDIPVAFGWTHYKEHAIDYVGKFDMKNDIAWLGPSFVHRKYRGKGLQQWIIQEGIRNAPARIKVFITSVNVGNKSSLFSFEKRGFKVGLVVCTKSGLLAKKTTDIVIRDNHSIEFLRIQK